MIEADKDDFDPGFYGKYSVTMLDDGIHAELTRHLYFLDSKKHVHEASTGIIIDGTSVPRLAWTLAGFTPFTGRQRKPAAIHDAECQALRAITDPVYRKQMRKRADRTMLEGCRLEDMRALAKVSGRLSRTRKLLMSIKARHRRRMIYRSIRMGAVQEEIWRSWTGHYPKPYAIPLYGAGLIGPPPA